MSAYSHRNCPKYYPDQLSTRKPAWVPSYPASHPNDLVYLNDKKLPQCPTGYIDAESRAWVDSYFRMKTAVKSTNSPYFSSIALADPLEVEMFSLFERETQSISHEIQDAVARRGR